MPMMMTRQAALMTPPTMTGVSERAAVSGRLSRWCGRDGALYALQP